MFKPVLLNLKTIIIYLIFLFGCTAVLQWLSMMDVPINDSIYYSSNSNILSIVYFAFFAIFAYESFINVKEAGLFESFSTEYNGLYKVWSIRLIILLLMSCISSLPIFIQYTFIFKKYNLSSLYYLHTLNSILINFVFVSIIGCMLGALISIKNNRKSAYLKIGISVLLVSPWLIGFVTNIYRHFDNFNSFNFFPLINRLRILPSNLRLGDHSIYGLPMETIRWETAIMLIVILTLAILRKLSKYKKKLSTYLLLAIIFLWISFAFIITPNDSLVRKDNRYFQGRESDWVYDSQFPQQLEEPNFSVAEYNMDFKIRR